MSKSVSAALLADIQKNATRLAVCLEIKRKDGNVLRLTNHDQAITLEGNRFRQDVPFSLSAIDTDSSLGVDTTELSFFCDGEVFELDHFRRGLYEYAEVRIFLVDFTAPLDGQMSLRKGWFGNIEWTENRVVKVTITGMLKILDFVVGRTVQPSCDADLGDARCMVAIDHSQIYSPINRYHLGNWVYYYDPVLVTNFSVVNSSFEVDGGRSTVQPITGWTRTPAAPNSFIVVSGSPPSAGYSPLDGSFMLVGFLDSGNVAPGTETGVYQDVDLLTQGGAGLTVAKIDDGRVFVGYIAALAQDFYLLDPVRIQIEIRDSQGVIIDSRDTGYIRLDTPNQWREKGHVFPLLPGSRSARLYIWFRKDDGEVFNHSADRVKFFWWDHTAGSPYSNVVHRLARLGQFADDSLALPVNASFESQGAVANANGPAITGWVTGAGNWWRVTSSGGGGGLANIHGLFYLKGGDDGGAVQRTYSITQTQLLTTNFGLDAARIILGKFVGNVSLRVGWTDTTSAATAVVDFLNATGGLVASLVLANLETNAGAPVWGAAKTAEFAVPAQATQVRVTLQARSPVGSGAAGVTFDNVEFHFYDAERPSGSDPVFGFGDTAGSLFATSPGAYTIDSALMWKAGGAFVNFDVVAAVPGDKVIRGTNIAGAVGQFETAAILWLSGANAGLKNLVRMWTPGTKDIKLYYRPIFPVQPGDRFMYKRACARRFTEDCVLVFGNGLNFRGFPHLPGKLDDA